MRNMLCAFAQTCLHVAQSATPALSPCYGRRSPHFGVAHAMCLGLAPWLAAEVPHMVDTGAITAKS